MQATEQCSKPDAEASNKVGNDKQALTTHREHSQKGRGTEGEQLGVSSSGWKSFQLRRTMQNCVMPRDSLQVPGWQRWWHMMMHVHRGEHLGEDRKQRNKEMPGWEQKKETTVSKFAYQQAGLSIRKLNLHAVSQDRMIMIFLIQVIQVDTELVRQNPNSNKDNNIIFLKNYTNSIHNFKHFKSIIY